MPLPADTAICRPGTSTETVEVHRASVPDTGQLLPAVADVTVLTRILSPVSGFFTVTENVSVAPAPTARFPVQVRVELANETLPTVAAASLLYVASSGSPSSGSVKLAPL